MSQFYLRIVEVDTGFKRIVYETTNDRGERIFYSLQVDSDQINFYRNDLFPRFEPEYIAEVTEGVEVIFEKPQGDTILEKAIRKYISQLEAKNESNRFKSF